MQQERSVDTEMLTVLNLSIISPNLTGVDPVRPQFCLPRSERVVRLKRSDGHQLLLKGEDRTAIVEYFGLSDEDVAWPQACTHSSAITCRSVYDRPSRSNIVIAVRHLSDEVVAVGRERGLEEIEEAGVGRSCCR